MAEENKAPEAGATDEQQNQKGFGIQNIYVKDVSFEAPRSPEVFREEFNPEIKMQMNSKSQKLADNIFEVEVSFTITAENKEGKVAFLVELTQAGIFNIVGLEGMELRGVLSATAPNILFPYARESITSLVNKGGFPHFNVAHIDFNQVFAQQLQKEQEQAAAQKTEAEA